MSIEKNINSRIVHKHDTEANWIKATNFIPKQGEIIVYDIDENYTYARFKIGDGLTLINDLPFTLVQSDWNQNNKNAADFIKNRIAWEESCVFGTEILNKDITLVPWSVNGEVRQIANTDYLIDDNNRTGCKNFIKSAEGTLFEININGQTYLKPLEYKTIKINGFIEDWVCPRTLGSLNEDICIYAWTETVDGDSGDGYGYLIVFKDPPPFSSGNITIREVIQPSIVHQLDPKYYERLAWTNESRYEEELVNNIVTPISSDGKIYSFEISQVTPFLIAGNYYSIKLNDIEYVGYCYGDGTLGNPYLLDPTEGIYTDDPLVMAFIELNDGEYSLYCRYLKEIFPFVDSINISVKKYIPEEIKQIEHKYYDSNGYFTVLWENPQCTFIGAQTMEINGITLHGGVNFFTITSEMMSKLDMELPIYVNFDGIDYQCPFDMSMPLLGNWHFYDSTFPDTGEPFLLILESKILVIAVLDQEEHTISIGQKIPHKIHKDLINVPLATSMIVGGVSPEVKEETDIQPVTIDENGRLWTEPTSNTVVRDDDNGNVVLISLATQNHENVVTDDGDGNVEVQSTSMYNPFPGIENAEIGQTVEIAEVDLNGFPTKWNAVDAGANSNIFIITMEEDPITGQPMASATPAEIYQQVIENKIILMPVEGLSCSLMECSETETSLIALIPNTEKLFFGIITIAEDRTITLESDTIDFTQFITTSQYDQDKTLIINELNNKITRPTNAAVGQVLSVKTVNTNGIPTAWETSSAPQFTKFIMPDTVTGTLYQLSIANGELQINAI